MKYLCFLLFLLINTTLIASENNCIKDLKKDYEEVYGKDVDREYSLIDLKLNESLTLKLVTAKLSCGAKACEYVGFLKNESDCLIRVIDFKGSFELGNVEANGIKSILVHQPLKENDEMICLWSYKIYLNKFERIAESCKVQSKTKN